ncbi:peroxidase-like isoform X2 [Daktulosphaira vitifoliae]|uniref:peroxidase-like isoform X2 n=1 Tax=Daktulosphaira vitifoliae TaxID=58002 RepID=UPI0021AA9085|nr:peroxidase-like isoform X2 [Daktulosphaira vitifoliae]
MACGSFWFYFTSLCLGIFFVDASKYPLYSINSPSSNKEYFKICTPIVKCDPNYKYRSMNGSCNNLENPTWGAVNTPHLRLLDAVYSTENLREFRKQKDGRPLPGSRELYLNLFRNKSNDEDDYFNIHFMQWSQFIAHDITQLPPNNNAEPTDCCAVQGSDNIPYHCQKTIKLPLNDPEFGNNKTCMPFKRAVTADDCPQLPYIFMVQSTQYIDLSHIYGNSDSESMSLRTQNGGLLRSDIQSNGLEFCPQQKRSTTNCGGRDGVDVCYEAGDPRVNQNLGIAAYTNLFLRYHNFLAKHLQILNPQWSDEILYQEARRILIALTSLITYRDFLPILLGQKYCDSVGLSLSNKNTKYNRKISASTGLEFAAAAYRVPHNTIPTHLSFVDSNHKLLKSVKLTDWMNNPSPLSEASSFNDLIRGMYYCSDRRPQPSYNHLISNFAFHFDTPATADQGLISVDVQRGRDTGLPTYVDVRRKCKLSSIKSFDDLYDIMKPNKIKILRKMYGTVEDIDLIVGMLLELPQSHARVGPTARCVLADGFYRYRYGDRFFFNVKGQSGSFKKEQLEALQDIDLGHILCVTTGLKEVPKDIFHAYSFQHESALNNMVSCKILKNKLNLSSWKSKN